MKLSLTLTAGICALGFYAASAADNSTAPKINVPGLTPAATPDAPAKPAFTEDQILQVWGWYMAHNPATGIAQLQITESELASINKGMLAAIKGQPPAVELEQIGEAVGTYLDNRQEKIFTTFKKKGEAETAALFANLKKNPNIVQLPSGLRYEILKQGIGPSPKPEQTVVINYTGTLINGTVFDSSAKRGKSLEIVLANVIPGWTEGLQKINKGGKIMLYIPAELAYGERSPGGIPPFSTLIFEVELLDIKDTPAAPPQFGPMPSTGTGQ